MAVNLLEVIDYEAEVDKQIFGDGVKDEIRKAKKALNDFAYAYIKVGQHKDEILAELNACRKKGDAAKIMRKVRLQYM